MTGILLIHGFAGGRREVLSLGLNLKQQGYKVVMPVLAGHENGYLYMSKFGYKDWLKSVEEAYKTLAKEVDEIIVIGFSMGGLLAVNLEQKYNVKALITINTPIYHWNFPQIVKNIKNDTKKFSKIYMVTCVDKPVNSLLEFKIFLRKSKPLIPKIKCPILVIQTMDDDTSIPKSTDYFKNKIGDKCTVKIIEKGGHVVLCSQYKDKVITEVEEYLKKVK